MSKMTKEESGWVRKMNILISKCPSDRIGFFTIGDPVIHLYDRDLVDSLNIDGDLIDSIKSKNAGFTESLDFPHRVDGVCG